jgi:guanylate kinase
MSLETGSSIAEMRTVRVSEGEPRREGVWTVLYGPTGVGKTTIVDRLLAQDPIRKKPISTTTRPIRPGEVDGVHYFFTDKFTFMQRVQEGRFLEYNAPYGTELYGTEARALDTVFAGSDLVSILDMKQGLRVQEIIQSAYKDNPQKGEELWERTLPILIGCPDDDVWQNRFMQRPGSTLDQFQERMSEDRRVLSIYDQLFPNIVVNLPSRASETADIINRMIEMHRTSMQI